MGKNFTGEDKLLQELNRLARENNAKSYKSRAAYKSHMRNFLRFYWRRFHGQKISNIEGKHIRAYAEYMKEQGLSPYTIKSRLSGIRFFHRIAGGKKNLPDNKELGLEKRTIGAYDRSWTKEEIEAAKEVALDMGRIDVYYSLDLAYAFGLRVEELCRVRLEQIEKVGSNGGLFIQGKGKHPRTVPIEVQIQKEALRRVYDYARKRHLLPQDYVISDRGKGGVERQINSLENWMYANRHKFTLSGRENEIRDGKKPRSTSLTWHGLRHTRAQKQHAMYKAEGRKDPKRMTSEILGHHRPDITNVYLAELPPSRRKKK